MAAKYLKRGILGWLGLVLAAIAVAWLAAWLLRTPGETLPAVQTEAERWFSAEELRRMLDFRGPQRLLGLGALVAELLVLGALVWWATPRLSRAWPRHPLLAAALAGAAISLVLAVAALPFGLISLQRSIDFGLSNQSVSGWLVDRGRGWAIGAAIAAVGAVLAVWMFRRLGRRWWIGGTALVAAYAIFLTWLGPVFIAPAFNQFDPLPEGPAREEILALAATAGVEVSDVLVVDAARRSNTINAYVTGLGSSRRIVVYDNALDELNRSELRAILAHELSHVKGRDVLRGVLWVILVAPLGVFAVQRAAVALTRVRGGRETTAAILPGLALCLTLAVLVLGVPGRDLSRQVEARADSFALELTKDPRGFIDLQRNLAKFNLSDPDPPPVWTFVFGTHPPTLERIGTALSLRRETGAGREAAAASAAETPPTAARAGRDTRAGS